MWPFFSTFSGHFGKKKDSLHWEPAAPSSLAPTHQRKFEEIGWQPGTRRHWLICPMTEIEGGKIQMNVKRCTAFQKQLNHQATTGKKLLTSIWSKVPITMNHAALQLGTKWFVNLEDSEITLQLQPTLFQSLAQVPGTEATQKWQWAWDSLLPKLLLAVKYSVSVLVSSLKSQITRKNNSGENWITRLKVDISTC